MAWPGPVLAMTALGRARTLGSIDNLFGAQGSGTINVEAAGPPQMRSPAMVRRASRGSQLPWPHFVTSPWRMPAVVSGFRVALSTVPSIGLPSIHDFTRRDSRDDPCRLLGPPARADPQTSMSRVVAARSHGGAPATRARTTAKHQRGNRIISIYVENPSRAESPKRFQSTPFACLCQGESRIASL